MALNLSEAADERSLHEMEKYIVEQVAGQGTFGTVQLAREKATGRVFAIKKVVQDPQFKNRELEIMQDLAVLNHPNVTQLLAYFYTRKQRNVEYLNVVMEFVKDTLHRCFRNYYRRAVAPPPLLIKVFLFQLIKSIGCLHLPEVNICHRDIKPHNVLVDEEQGVLKLCDFGSAKKLNPSEPNVAYICSRYYRAPELIFGNRNYTTEVDIWSVGCIFAEMMLGEPVFRGRSSSDQLLQIVKILGSPTRDDMAVLNEHGATLQVPSCESTPWRKVFSHPQPDEAFDLLGKMLRYVPSRRVKPYEALVHPYFDELRKSSTRLPSGKPLPSDLYKFLPEEVKAMTAEQREKLTGVSS